MIDALMIVPRWTAQFWWPMLMKPCNRMYLLGRSNQILINGPRAKKKGWQLPPGELVAVWIN
jgi:hypothetical protein